MIKQDSSDALFRHFDPKLSPLAFALASAATAIVVDRYFGVPLLGWLLVAVCALASWLIVSKRVGVKTRNVALLVAVGSLAGAWHHANWFLFAANDIGHFAGRSPQPVVVEAIALSSCSYSAAPPVDPLRTIPKQDETHLRLRVISIRDGAEFKPATGKCTITVGGELSDIYYGDRVRVAAMLVRPSPPMNPGESDYAAFLRSKRELCFLRADIPESVQVIERGSMWSPLRLVHTIRSAGMLAIDRSMSKSRRPLAAAVLLGAREELPSSRVEPYFETGSVHLLAISGLHVGILAYAIWFVAQLFPISRRMVLVVVMAFVVGYALLTDSRPPVVRAAVLVSTICLSQWWSRPTRWINVLSLAGLIVLAMNPVDLFQSGAQLSFLAVGSLAAAYPLLFRAAPIDPLDRLIAQTRPWWVKLLKQWRLFVWRMFLVGAVIWVISLPLVMWRFHLVSPIALLINLLVIPLMGFALIFGLIAVMTMFVIPPVGAFAGGLCGMFLGLIESIVRLSAQLPFSHFWTPGPALVWVLLFYSTALLWLVGWKPLSSLSPRWLAALVSCWFAVSFLLNSPIVSRLLAPRHELRCTFLSVGHGTSVCVELPGGKTFLYDAGRLGSHKAGVQIVSAYLWSRNKSQLDGVVISHADADHYNAAPGVLERFPTTAVYYSPIMFREDSAALEKLAAAIKASGAKIIEVSSESTITNRNGVAMHLLHPPPGGVVGGDNANSIVLLLEYENRVLLLPGDLEDAGLRNVLLQPPIDCDIIMAPHHGSIRSNPIEFANWSQPEHVIISGGDVEKSQAAIEQFQSTGANVWHTDEVGAVQVIVSGDDMSVQSFRK